MILSQLCNYNLFLVLTLGIFVFAVCIFGCYLFGYVSPRHLSIDSGKTILKFGIFGLVFGLFNFLLLLDTPYSQYYGDSSVLLNDFDIVFLIILSVSVVLSLKSTSFVTWLLNVQQGSLVEPAFPASVLFKKVVIILILCVCILIPSVTYYTVASNVITTPISISESSNGKYIAVTMINDQSLVITLWDPTTGSFLRTLNLPSTYCQAYTYVKGCNTNYYTGVHSTYLYWSPNDTQLAMIIPGEQDSYTNNSLLVWDIQTGNVLYFYEWSGQYTQYSNVVWATSTILLAYWTNNTINIYDLGSGTVLQGFPVNTTLSQQKPFFSPDGNVLAIPVIVNVSNRYLYGIQTWKTANQKYTLGNVILGNISFIPFPDNFDYIHDLIYYPVQWNANISTVYMELATLNVPFYQEETAVIQFNINALTSSIVYKNASSNRIFGISPDNTVLIMDNSIIAINNGTIIATINTSYTSSNIACNTDCSQIISYKYPHTLHISDIYTGKVFFTFNINPNNFYMQLSLVIALFSTIIGISTFLIGFYKIFTE